MEKLKLTLDGKAVLVTGSPGFIGANLVMRLLSEMRGGTVISLDCMNDYYDVRLKEYRLARIEEAAARSGAAHVFIRGSIADKPLVDSVFEEYKPDIVVNLAAQAGVRYSIDHPEAYIESNITGFFNILEACRRFAPQHLVYASSSSVYGASGSIPFSPDNRTDEPVSLYAATKKSGELIAYSYAKLYDIPMTGLRFFTVYGPAGRPDMFYYSAAEKLIAGEKLRLFNYGDCMRDFTYIDDIVEGVYRVMLGTPVKRRGGDGLPEAPHALYNIGAGRPESLMEFIRVLHAELIRTGLLEEGHDLAAQCELAPMQPGDVPVTYADCTALERDYGFRPSVDIRFGLARFAEWFSGLKRNQAYPARRR